MSWPERKEEGAACSFPLFPRASCAEAGFHRALFTTREDKDQSEQLGGVTSERRKEREGQRGRREGREDRGRGEHRLWHIHPPQGVGMPAAEDHTRLSPTETAGCHQTSPLLHTKTCFQPGPPPAQSNGQGPKAPRPPAQPGYPPPGQQTHHPARLVHLFSTGGTSFCSTLSRKRGQTQTHSIVSWRGA